MLIQTLNLTYSAQLEEEVQLLLSIVSKELYFKSYLTLFFFFLKNKSLIAML